MQIINDKKIKTFKDLQNTFYTIYQKANRHYYLTIQKANNTQLYLKGQKIKYLKNYKNITKTINL